MRVKLVFAGAVLWLVSSVALRPGTAWQLFGRYVVPAAACALLFVWLARAARFLWRWVRGAVPE